eukprot:PhF_6_TR25084/c0_g2_i4/m.34439/K01721/nthA; nitrile hydratase subunit alpha
MTSGFGGAHDLGGISILEKVGPIPEGRVYTFWEKRLHALLIQLVAGKHISVDEFRRAIEGLEPTMYSSLTYYEKWAAAITTILIERKVISRSEVDRALGPLPKEVPTSELFRVGDIVYVRPETTTRRWRKPHLRVPGYIYGCKGTVVDIVGVFTDPAYSAFRETSPPQPLYRVRIDAKEVWGCVPHTVQTIEADIFHPWLTKDKITQKNASPSSRGTNNASADRVTVEQKAVESEASSPPLPLQWLGEAIVDICIQKGFVTSDSLRSGVEKLDNLGIDMLGSRLVARAWVDEEFKKLLLRDAAKAAEVLGIVTSNYSSKPTTTTNSTAHHHHNDHHHHDHNHDHHHDHGIVDVSVHPDAPPHYPHGHTVLKVLENTPTVHHVVVCTLCSCYPTALLGLAPDWYKSKSYRSRVVLDPRGVLKEFGLVLPEGVEVRVVDSTAELRYLVLPIRPQGTEGWGEEELRRIISRDSMIGVTIPSIENARSKL